MKNKKRFTLFSIGGLLLFLGTGLLINHHLEKKYNKGDYISEIDAYFDHKVDNPTGHIKAEKCVTPSDDKYNSQKTRSLGSSLIGNIESVWDNYTGEGTVIAIIDDGFDVDHPEFKRSDNSSAILPTSRSYYIDDKGTSSYSDDEVVYQQYSNNPTCLNEEWEESESYEGQYQWGTHGTNTSTTAAAPMGNGGGVGIAPGADILALKIDFSFDAIESAIYYAIEQGVDVINMSLGAYADYNFTDGFGDVHNNNSYYGEAGYAEIAGYLENACVAAYNAGIIVVAAAGNEATWHKSYPACNSHVVGVGAIGDKYNKGNANELAEFTNYVSSSQTGEINVDILAPGYVYTAAQTYAHSSDKQSSSVPSSHGHTYQDTQGTSFSSPIVAGAACLWKQKNPTGTPDQFLSELQASADGIGYYSNKMVPVSGWYSYLNDVGPSKISNGRLNVSRLLGSDAYVNVDQTNLYLTKGETKQITISSSNGNISYQSNNENVATVSNDGLITAVEAGNTTITVTATVGSNSATATIYVNVQDIVNATSLTFNPNEITIEVDETYDAEQLISLTPSNASRIFLFESEDEDIAIVDDETGEITGISEGTTTINALAVYGDGLDSLTVHVTEATTPTYWEKITTTNDIETGDYLIVYEEGSKAYDGSINNLDVAKNNINVTISNNKILYDETTAASKFTITELSNGYTIKSASGYYIGRDGSSNGMDVSSSDEYLNSITISSGSATILGSGGKQLLFNTATDQQRFRYITPTTSNIALYKANGSGGTTPTPTKTLSSITLDTTNVKVEFEINETFNYSGLVVTAHYSDNSSNIVIPTNVSTPDTSTTGNKTVTVTYTENEVSKTASYGITVSSGSVEPSSDFNGTYNVDNVGDTWSLSNYTNQGSYLLCPSTGTYSVAFIDDLFDGKEITSDVVISLSVATYDNGNNPTDSTFRIYSEQSCTNEVSATRSGTLPTSSSYTTVTYTVSQSNASSLDEDLAIKITKPGKLIRVASFTVSFSYEQGTPKVISELEATYLGDDLYVGEELDYSEISVVAKYTDSSKYPNLNLSSSDYEISGFESTFAGEKTVTVTYTGSTQTLISPLTTTFNVLVKNDNVKLVSVSCSKSYHPGETIDKSDITVTLTFDSGKEESTTDFIFGNDGYMFTYADAPSGGSSLNKQFSITYNNQNYNFTVSVSREAHKNLSLSGDTLTRATTGVSSGSTSYSSWNNKQGSSGTIYAGNTAGDHDSIQIRAKSDSGIVMTASGGNVKRVSVTWNNSTMSGRILEIYGKNTAYTSSSDLYNANSQGTLLGTIVYGTSTYFDITGDYAYIGVKSNDGALYLTNIVFSFNGEENAVNFSNFMMFEDTNNQCTTKLDDAIELFENMSEEERNTFMTSNDYVIKQARDRLEAWLINQEKTISYVDGDYVISNNKHTLSLINNNNENIIIIVISSLFVVSFVSSLFLFKKKKH